MNRLFPELPTPKMHPANIGHNLTRTGEPMPEKLAELYCARVLALSLFDGDFKQTMSGLRTVFHTGAKIVARAAAPKKMGSWDQERFKLMQFYITLAHGEDPELIFDAFLTADIQPTVAAFRVPEEAFALLNRPVEERHFDAARLTEPDERTLWYVARALQFAQAGFESVTLDEAIPEEVERILRRRLPLVFRGAIPSAVQLSEEPEDALLYRWTAEKQREH